MKNSGLAIFLFLVFGLLVQDIYLVTFLRSFIPSDFYSDRLAFAVISICAVAVVYKFVITKRDDTKNLLKVSDIKPIQYIFALTIGVLMVPLSLGLISLEVLITANFSLDTANNLWGFEQREVIFESNGKLGSNFWGILAFVMTHSLLGPLMEELTFRGAMLSIWYQKFGLVKSLVFTSLLFMLIHPINMYLDIFVYSMIIGWLTLRTGKIVYAFIVHMTYNTTSWLLEGYNLLEFFRSKSPSSLADFKTWYAEFFAFAVAVSLIALLSKQIQKMANKEYCSSHN